MVDDKITIVILSIGVIYIEPQLSSIQCLQCLTQLPLSAIDGDAIREKKLIIVLYKKKGVKEQTSRERREQ